ncbi:MAG TPA: helix-turn-helix domain-containing protein [Oligoflexus sp.]|uniref:helix-turn-helix domain-containing protein n=1 Tax=Oligoflexus sp. TaxID=1971216 RepID=UPI002D48B16A|nr:helix-turn-helix domain-containing protein [Oligoflexus sp.]HYX38047.1 helix-turn-helix domain-containing protein [Oligoflexus sp.]
MSLAGSSPYFSQMAGGDYLQIIATAVDSRDARLNPEDIPWVVGALTLVGRNLEADGLLQRWISHLTPAQWIAARCYLGSGFCREGRHDLSRKIFLNNLRDAKAAGDSQSLCFAYQGLGFYRYFQGRLHAARIWGQAGVKQALAADFDYGYVLTMELLGHSQLKLGQIHIGFRTLSMARKRAQSFGTGALLQAMDHSMVMFKSAYGVAKHSDEIVTVLQETLKRRAYEDSYTQAHLNLELSRVLLLRGQLRRSKTLLERTSELVYRIDNPNLEMDHNLHLAHILRKQGEAHQALSLVRAARHRAQSRPDLRQQLRSLGFEAQLLGEMGRAFEQQALLVQVESLTRRCGSLVGWRTLQRLKGTPGTSRSGDDLLGDLMDQVKFYPSSALQDIVRTGWLGFLPHVMGLRPHECALVFDVELGSVTIIDRGEVEHKVEGCSGLMRKLIKWLAKGESAKDQLTSSLWGRSYDPGRHDKQIYGLVAKTRRFLGPYGEWIEASESGYRLRPQIRVLTQDLRTPQPMSLLQGDDADREELPALNIRQATVLSWMRAGEIIEPKALVDRLKVSDATASRDLAKLLELGLAYRMGKGRTTRYAYGPP